MREPKPNGRPRLSRNKKVPLVIEALMGKYEQQLLRLSLSRNLTELDNSLYRFFREFPEKKSPDDFSRLDVEYYKRIRTAEKKSEKETEQDIVHVRAFFNFLLEYLGYRGPNPASEKQQSMWVRQRDLDRLSLEDNSRNSQEYIP